MRVEHPEKFRKLSPARCRFCDRRFFYRQAGRPAVFCSPRCRQADFRYGGYLQSKRDESVQKTPIKSKASKVDFHDRPLPLNMLGGHRWSNSVAIDRETLAEIVRTEIGGFKSSETGSESPDPNLAEIPVDQSIPIFLQRRTSKG